MRINSNIYKKLDWPLIIMYLVLVTIGWLSVFSSVYDEEYSNILDFSQRSGMQLIWILSSFLIAILIIFIINPKIYSVLSFPIYIFTLLLLFAVIFLGVEVSGSKSWLALGPIRFQPAEFAKISVALLLSSLMSTHNFRLSNIRSIIKIAFIVLTPLVLIIMEKETGLAIVLLSMIFVLYREGLSGWFMILGLLAIAFFIITLMYSPFVSIIILASLGIIILAIIRKHYIQGFILLSVSLPLFILSPKLLSSIEISALKGLAPVHHLFIVLIPYTIYFIYLAIKNKERYYRYIFISFFISILLIFSVQFLFEQVLQSHQRERIENLLGVTQDLKGAGYNVHQSKIAIGSGGFMGKGFLKGTQTKFNFVPEQSTDFIFCTIGEEWGFIGSLILIVLYVSMIRRILKLAERQKESFNRIFGYSLASFIFIHFFINIGMTMGVMPVIGIPLPYISYGGSSMWAFTIFLFIFIRLDLERWR